jgi:hypothetical protein
MNDEQRLQKRSAYILGQCEALANHILDELHQVPEGGAEAALNNISYPPTSQFIMTRVKWHLWLIFRT